MKRQRNIVNRFVDLEARVADEAEEEEEEDNDNMVHGMFTDVIVHIPAHEFITEAFICRVHRVYIPRPARVSNLQDTTTATESCNRSLVFTLGPRKTTSHRLDTVEPLQPCNSCVPQENDLTIVIKRPNLCVPWYMAPDFSGWVVSF